MAQICIKLLLSEPGVGKIFLLNRSRERIDSFLKNNLSNTDRLQTSFAFEDRHALAAAADLVIVSASAPGYLIEQSHLKRHASDGKQVCIIDISVPRNVEPSVGDMATVKLFHADDLAGIVSANLAERELLVKDAEEIVFQVLDEFHCWQRSLLVVPTIAGLRQKIEAIRQEQMAKTRGCCDSSDDDSGQQQVEDISRAIVNQILHHPTVQLKATRDYEILRQQAEALRTLFNLDPLGSETRRSGAKKSLH